MSKVTLRTLLEEIRKNGAKTELRFQRVDEQLQKHESYFQLLFQQMQKHEAHFRKHEAHFRKHEAHFQSLDRQIQRLEARQDSHFQLLKEQIQRNSADIVELRSDMRSGFSKVHRDLSVVRDQTALITERVTALEQATRAASAP